MNVRDPAGVDDEQVECRVALLHGLQDFLGAVALVPLVRQRRVYW